MMRQQAARGMSAPGLSMALLALLSFFIASMAELRGGKPAGPVLQRHKREWLWNSLYVEEERPAPVPYKIGQLRSTKVNERTHYEIVGEGVVGHNPPIFMVNENGDLFVTSQLDREQKSKYLLRAKLLDDRSNLVEREEDFVVLVTDINDNDPVFPPSFNASIRERSHKGTKVITASATDADDPTTANAALRYTLLQGGDVFDIDSSTGLITTKFEPLDREHRSLYVLVVQAQDTWGKKQGGTATTSVSITLTDINDNMASFTRKSYEFKVPENQKLDVKLGTLELEDRDELHNKDPIFTIAAPLNIKFDLERSPKKDGNLMLKQPLDYETQSSYTFSVDVRETNLQEPADNKNLAVTKAQVVIQVLDVDEPPLFTRDIYTFSVKEETMVTNIGVVKARDPDRVNKTIRYSIEEIDCPVGINPITGQLSTQRKLDRELKATYMIQVKAQEEPQGLASFVKVNLLVIDINDNEPELSAEDVFVCENDMKNTVIGTIRATDKDEQTATFSFSLMEPSSNFSVIDNKDNTANILLKHGSFSVDDPRDYILEIGINDGGRPAKSSVTSLPIRVCRCDRNRIHTQCKAAHLKMGVSTPALIAILLCILTILVIVILFVLRKRYQKEALVSMGKNAEIHEQLVTYDEEGGGEMDTNGYDVSILTSARHDGSMMCQGPSLYAMVQRPPACKGDMAVMIEVKKDEADHDRDGIPYDTLHIYGYEGPESLAGSLSSLDNSSTSSNLDYDFLQDWGPRFRPLAELYGVDGPDTYSPY
ncbi:cadherin-5 [Osmerus eperlanus]|uniref:cadherin-5 n=1 Tax=Osmerus eperlanus TaxID=29151 RepID=UPI002E157CD4